MKKFQNLERNLRTPRTESSLSTFAFLFSEYMQMLKKKHGQDNALIQEKLEKLGNNVGVRLYEIVCLRERNKREIKLIDQLKFVQVQFWKAIFGKQADSLEKLKNNNQHDYLIRDENPLILRYIGEESTISPAQFMVGILQGVFDVSGFTCKVSYQFKTDERDHTLYPHTQFIICFDEASIKKENL